MSIADILKDRYGRRELHCQCGQAVLVSLKYLYEEGNCLKWYGVQVLGSDRGSGWIERCPACGVEFGYPPPLQEQVSMRRSVQPTYDSRLAGHAYHVTYRVNGKAITFREPIADPFIRGRVTVGWWDLVRSLFRGGLTVEVQVGADEDRINDVLELDANALVRNSSRRKAFDVRIQGALEKL